MSLQEVQIIVRRLDAYVGHLKEKRRDILEYAAAPVVDAQQRLAPVGIKIHTRYNTPKVMRQLRAPAGRGVVRAKYLPGNLRGSVQILRKLKKTPDVFVGPVVARMGGSGTFGRSKYDAYYAHMVEYGTRHSAAQPFLRPGWSQAKPQVIKRLTLALRLFTEKYGKKYGV